MLRIILSYQFISHHSKIYTNIKILRFSKGKKKGQHKNYCIVQVGTYNIVIKKKKSKNM